MLNQCHSSEPMSEIVISVEIRENIPFMHQHARLSTLRAFCALFENAMETDVHVECKRLTWLDRCDCGDDGTNELRRLG